MAFSKPKKTRFGNNPKPKSQKPGIPKTKGQEIKKQKKKQNKRKQKSQKAKSQKKRKKIPNGSGWDKRSAVPLN